MSCCSEATGKFALKDLLGMLLFKKTLLKFEKVVGMVIVVYQKIFLNTIDYNPYAWYKNSIHIKLVCLDEIKKEW